MAAPPSSDPQAFTDLFDRYAQPIFRHCYFHVRNAQMAEDLLQETFVRTWEYLATGKHISNEKAFLYRTASNLIVDEIRRMKRRPTVTLDEELEKTCASPHDVASEVYGEMERQRLFALLDRIGEPYRSLLILRYVDHCPPREIAQILGRSPAVISVQLHRAIRKLRSLLEHE